jgi:hypothetical protein
MWKKIGAVALAVLLSACASPLSGEYAVGKGKTMLVPKEVWGWYKDYVTKISGVNAGLFVVGLQNGTAVAYSAYYCPATKCIARNMGKQAIDGCKGLGHDLECVLFARSADIQVNYKLLDE